MKIYKKSQDDEFVLEERPPIPKKMEILRELIAAIRPIVESRVKSPEQTEEVLKRVDYNVDQLSSHLFVVIDYVVEHM